MHEPPQLGSQLEMISEVIPTALAPCQTSVPRLNPRGLLNLPAEIIVMIMQYLDGSDVLSLRKCAIELKGPSRERSVWLSIIQRDVTRLARPFWLPKPLGECSSKIIEKHLVGWSRGPTFTPTEPLRPSTRKFPVPDITFVHRLGFTPDGRFDLKVTLDGAIYSFDSHNAARAAVLLCPKPSCDAVVVDRFTNMAFDCISGLADGELFPVTFTGAAMHFTKTSDVYGWENIVIEIWRFTRTESGYSTQRLASFIEDADRTVGHFSIYGEHIAYNVHDEGGIAIVDWTSAPAGTTAFPRIHVCPNGFPILLPGRRIAIIKEDWISIHRWDNGYHNPGRRKLYLNAWGAEAEVWREEVPCGTLPLSPSSLYLVGDTARFVVTSIFGVTGVIVPLSGDLYRTVPLFKPKVKFHTLGAFRHFGYQKGVMLGSDGTVTLLKYFWPDERPVRGRKMVTFPGFNFTDNLNTVTFDEARNEVSLWMDFTKIRMLYKL